MTPENGQEFNRNNKNTDSCDAKKQDECGRLFSEEKTVQTDGSDRGVPTRKPTFYEKYTKRVVDILLSICGIICLIPVFLLISVAIEIDDPGPVLFFQRRGGRYGKPFTMLKFRTMKTSAPHDIPSGKLKNSSRYITRIGRFLRKSSLDELPQLLHILTGKMSIIGPRPLILGEKTIAEREKYGANDVRPGLTGWAQINGRDGLSDEEKARYDGEYVQKMSFRFDCKCFFRTIGKVIKCEDITEGDA